MNNDFIQAARMGTVLVSIALLLGCKGKPARRHDAGTVRISDAPNTATDAATADAAAKPARLEHDVWNLVDNRHTAHRGVDGELLLDARTVGFARYTRFGMPQPQWQLGATVAGERVAIADKVASLEIPIIPEQKPPTQVTLRVHADDKQALELRVNGRKAGKTSRIALEAGWQTIAFSLDADAMRPGENVVSLQTTGKSKQKVALSWLRVGALHPSADQDPLAAATFDAKADTLELADHASLTWYVTLPEGAHVVAEVPAPCLVEVGARAGDAAFVGGLLAADQDRVDLSSLAGKTVRLSLMARDCPRARIAHPRITVHGPAPEPLPKADPPRYVLVWKLAALRADPGFDDLARASTVFRQLEWAAIDRAELGKQIATAAKLPAILIADATVDALLARFDKARDKPGFWFADTSSEQGPQLGRVIAQLKSWGIWDQTMLLVTDGRELAIHDAARFPSGTVIEEGAEASDLVPTVLDALGQSPGASEGASLAPLAQGMGRGWARPSYVKLGDTHVMRIGSWMIRVAGGTAVPTLTNVVDDPRGMFDLAGTRPIERRLLTDGLGLLLPVRSQWRKSEWGVVSNLTPVGAHALDELTP
jgi:hypothetical protein